MNERMNEKANKMAALGGWIPRCQYLPNTPLYEMKGDPILSMQGDDETFTICLPKRYQGLTD